MLKVFNKEDLGKLYRPPKDSSGEDNGQVTIIGGSSLFHGAPLLSLKVASRIVDMVFFSSPEPSLGKVADEFKSKLFSFIWVPWEEIDSYIKKSDAVLIGPGLMRYRSEVAPEGKRNHKFDDVARESREITRHFLEKYPDKPWVIDAGSLQVMEAGWVPKNAILTPNDKEYTMLFGETKSQKAAKDYNCIIIRKGPVDAVYSPGGGVKVTGGNAGLTKGGTGDVLAGLCVALSAKNDPFFAAQAAAFLTKAAADKLYKSVGTGYNADDLVETVPEVLHALTR
jgi:hydroxyethylthiazole kinase-like uncharacterized protein yjeF